MSLYARWLCACLLLGVVSCADASSPARPASTDANTPDAAVLQEGVTGRITADDGTAIAGATVVAASLDGAAGLHHTSLLIVLGHDDQYATPVLIEEQERRLRDARFPFDLVRFEGGHYIDRATLREVAER